MTQDDIHRVAREANRYASNQTGDSFEWQGIRDERFAALVAAAEREVCAKLCETYETASIRHEAPSTAMIFNHCAKAIRARSTP